MAKNKIDAFEEKINTTYQAINNLVNKDASYQKQRDYSQLMITTSSTFADISDILIEMPEKVKNEKVNKYANALVNTGVDVKEANNAVNALFGKKQITKSMCEKVFCPYVKETFNLLRNDGYVDMGKIENAILNNDQDFELSPLLNKEVKALKNKDNFIYKLFHKNENKIENVNKNVSKVKETKDSKTQIAIKEAMADESKAIKDSSKIKTVQNTKELTKSIDDICKR